MSKELVQKAIELGIQNVETLTTPQLKIAIETAEKEVESKQIEAQAAAIAEENSAKVCAALAEFLGVENLDSLTPEQLTSILAQKATADAAGVEVIEDEEGKTDKVFKALNGNTYGFKEDAPANFRYLGQLRTQEEWMSDKDAMALMVDGELSFLTLKK